MSDPFGRAIREFARGEQTEPLLQVDGEREREHPVEEFYFAERDPESEYARWLESHLSGPLLDLGAGAGRDALHFQARFETVALEVSAHLVETMRDRGVENAVRGDMFDLPATFGRDRFAAAYAHGTQLGLVRSRTHLREFLGDLAFVTSDDAVAVLDNYDPEAATAGELLGARADPEPGMGLRAFHFEYERERGETLVFRPFAPRILDRACVGTAWRLVEVRYTDDHHYDAVLRKEHAGDPNGGPTDDPTGNGGASGDAET
ncbi:class I SAM-dependent methyltransferase [Candidatus Halobonum tyrrellensis]|uniref:SAM-dependent methyltransferase n=1 Tax=Candidatus Halobonum tyrrellensis G22 TaxID=1324957 RepID=V4HCV5_9EURY|nr:class I SAM-dependent methyltransferase [Candidatus Halobonum tyrrellensis]ESP88545.1 hypothetical protein K933_08797 [Candidatus Halobonum tyrrellensis G22]